MIFLFIFGMVMIVVGVIMIVQGLDFDSFLLYISGFIVVAGGFILTIGSIAEAITADNEPSFEQICDAHGGFVLEDQCLRADNIEKVDIG